MSNNPLFEESAINSLTPNEEENDNIEICNAVVVEDVDDVDKNNDTFNEFDEDDYDSPDVQREAIIRFSLLGNDYNDEEANICNATVIEDFDDSDYELSYVESDKDKFFAVDDDALIGDADDSDDEDVDICDAMVLSDFDEELSDNDLSTKPCIADNKEKKTVNDSKKSSEKLILQNLENEITSKLMIIRHNDGLCYYTGRTYETIKNAEDLLEIIRLNVSHDGFGVSDTKIFRSLYSYLKAAPDLIPKNYKEKLKKSKKYVVMKNGVLNLDTLELEAHSPKYLTFFELNANWVDEESEVFNQFLYVSCQGDKQAIRRTKEALGYIFSGLNDAKVFFVIGIARDSGKSTLGIVIEVIIGENYVSAISPEKLGGRFDLGDIKGKMLNIAMDVPDGKLNSNAVSMIKSITGGDRITIEQKYMPAETIISDMRFLFGTNYPLRLSSNNDEDAFWKRMVIIPYTNSISDDDKDNNMKDRLLKEKDAIVSECLRAYKRVRDNNNCFSRCQVADDMLKEWRNGKTSSYSFYAFWNDNVEVTGNDSDKIYTSELYEAYTTYCINESLEPIPYNTMLTWIETNVDSGMCVRHRIHESGKNPKSGYLGIRLYED